MTSQYRKNYQAIWQRGYRLRNRKPPILRVSGGRAHTKRAGIPDGTYDVTVTDSCVYLFPKVDA